MKRFIFVMLFGACRGPCSDNNAAMYAKNLNVDRNCESLRLGRYGADVAICGVEQYSAPKWDPWRAVWYCHCGMDGENCECDPIGPPLKLELK